MLKRSGPHSSQRSLRSLRRDQSFLTDSTTVAKPFSTLGGGVLVQLLRSAGEAKETAASGATKWIEMLR